jgi:4-amino-4-deoxy-L-arabinose transferase-like glycosyltransferase
MSHFRLKNLLWLDILLIAAAALLLGTPSLIYPFGRDQGQYAWIAASALNGNVPYSDIFEVKPPLTHIVHQVALLLFGHGMSSIRILDLLWQFAAAVLLYKIAAQMEQPRWSGIVAGILYLLFHYRWDFWNIAQTDGFISLPVAVGVLLFLHAQQRDRFWLYAASGAAISLGSLLKYPIGVLVVFLSLLLLVKYGKKGLLPALWMGIGFATPLLVCALVMFLRGSLADFLWTQSIYIPKYSTIPHEDLSYAEGILLGFLWAFITPAPGWISVFGIYGLVDRFSRSRWMQTAVLAVWWVSAVIHFVVQNKFYDYHALPVYAPLALMVGGLFADVSKKRGMIRFALGIVGVGLAFSLFFSADFPQKYIRLYEVASGDVSLQTAYGNDLFANGRDFSSRADLEVAEYLRSHTGQDEKVFIWGFESGVYFLSHRQNATRFIYNIMFYGRNASPELKQQLLEQIRVEKPTYIIVVRNDVMHHVTDTFEDSLAAFHSFDELHNFVLENYRFETTMEDFVFYRLIP